jgi:ribonucleoside-diphosphate reductase alpha chain
MTKKQHLGIKIDLSKDEVLSDQALKLLKDYYCNDNEDTPQKAFARAAVAYSYGDMGLAQRIYNAVSNGWFMYASPVLSNAPEPNEKVKALPISCFLNLCTRFIGRTY